MGHVGSLPDVSEDSGSQWPDDAVVSEMINHLPVEKIYTITRCFQERFLGQMDAPSSWKIVKLVFPEKPDVEPKKRIRSKKSDRPHKCHVEVVRVLCDDAHGKRAEARDFEKTSYGRSQQNKLSTSTGVAHKSLTKTLGMARGKISHVETWERDSTNNVYGKLEHQDSLRRGEAEAYCEIYGESQHTRMADRGPLT